MEVLEEKAQEAIYNNERKQSKKAKMRHINNKRNTSYNDMQNSNSNIIAESALSEMTHQPEDNKAVDMQVDKEFTRIEQEDHIAI
ncbi:40505_t:CDS:2, partial [Gigaspora margarita]